MLASVIYNRSERCYELENEGEVLTFPAGVNGRQQAFQTAVQLENSALYELAAQMASDHPQLASRVWRACEIVLTGEVILKDGLAIVPSQSSEFGGYTVQMVDGLQTCDCEDFRGGTAVYIEGNEQPFCKHILAAQFALVLA